MKKYIVVKFWEFGNPTFVAAFDMKEDAAIFTGLARKADNGHVYAMCETLFTAGE